MTTAPSPPSTARINSRLSASSSTTSTRKPSSPGSGVLGPGEGSAGAAEGSASGRGRLPHRQCDREGRARVLAFAVAVHHPSVQLDQVPDDGEAQPEAAVPARRRGVGLAKPLEERGHELGGDADAGVAAP